MSAPEPHVPAATTSFRVFVSQISLPFPSEVCAISTMRRTASSLSKAVALSSRSTCSRPRRIVRRRVSKTRQRAFERSRDRSS
eukprot:2232457-Rhodomonas_salina.1